MCKLFVAVVLLAVVCAHPTFPTADEIKEKLIAAGLSADAAAGVVAIGEKYRSQLEAAKGDREAGKKIFDQIKTETNTYIETQSPADQTAYKAFVEKKKAEFEAHKSAAAAGSA